MENQTQTNAALAQAQAVISDAGSPANRPLTGVTFNFGRGKTLQLAASPLERSRIVATKKATKTNGVQVAAFELRATLQLP